MNEMTYVGWDDGTSLYHYGIAGQRWGQRRFQNEDGSLTEEGKRRYGYVGNVRKIGLKEYAADRRKRIKAESEAIRNSKRSNREKANALKRLGDHEHAAEYYKKDAMNKKRLATIGAIGYAGAAAITSKVLMNSINTGKMTPETALKIGNYANTGRKAAAVALGLMTANSWKNYRSEYWKPNK